MASQRAGQRVALSHQRGNGCFGGVQAGQALAGLARPGQHSLDVGGVLAGEPLEVGLAEQHLLQPGRVGVQRLEIAAELSAHVTEQRRSLPQASGQHLQPGIRHRLQPAAGLPDQTDRARLVGVEVRRTADRSLRDGGDLPQLIGVGEPSSLHRQRTVFPRLRVDGGDLSDAVPEQVGFPGQLPRVLPPGGQLGPAAQPLLPDAAVGVQWPGDRIAGKAIQHGTLLTGPQQPQLVVLTVYRKHAVGQVGEHPRRDRATTQVGPGAAVGGESAAGDQAAVLIGPGAHLARQVRCRAALRWPEAALNDGAVGATANPGGVSPPTGEQVQTGDHHGLTCSGLTGHHRQTGVQVQGGLVDHTEALDAHLGEHEPHPSAPRRVTGQLGAGRASPAPAARTYAPTGR